LTVAARITFAHFSPSARICWAKSSEYAADRVEAERGEPLLRPAM
jgi:hypothetical protein